MSDVFLEMSGYEFARRVVGPGPKTILQHINDGRRHDFLTVGKTMVTEPFAVALTPEAIRSVLQREGDQEDGLAKPTDLVCPIDAFRAFDDTSMAGPQVMPLGEKQRQASIMFRKRFKERESVAPEVLADLADEAISTSARKFGDGNLDLHAVARGVGVAGVANLLYGEDITFEEGLRLAYFARYRRQQVFTNSLARSTVAPKIVGKYHAIKDRRVGVADIVSRLATSSFGRDVVDMFSEGNSGQRSLSPITQSISPSSGLSTGIFWGMVERSKGEHDVDDVFVAEVIRHHVASPFSSLRIGVGGADGERHFVSYATICHDETLFGDDVHTFNPQRFTDTAVTRRLPTHVFGLGSHHCPASSAIPNLVKTALDVLPDISLPDGDTTSPLLRGVRRGLLMPRTTPVIVTVR